MTNGGKWTIVVNEQWQWWEKDNAEQCWTLFNAELWTVVDNGQWIMVEN